MKVIYKYILKVLGLNLIQTYAGAEILSAGVDANGDLCAWMLVDTSKPAAERGIIVVGTGWDLGDDWNNPRFINTVNTGPYIWHVFDEGEQEQE